ncbi:MAG: hypothetical protein JO000_16840 [Alphaproteobacteria bacterium]|nr:hypothetical protein [Alphaproteobacteria bacterium]
MKAVVKVALALSVLLATGSLSFAAHAHKSARHRAAPYPAYPMQGARMIELRKGWWVSSYECFTDEGYGRFRSCSAN